MPKFQHHGTDRDPAKPDDSAVKIDVEACVESFPKDNLIPIKADEKPPRRWMLVALLVLLLIAAVGLGAALAVHLLTDCHSSPETAASSSSSPSNTSQGAVVDHRGDGLELDSGLVSRQQLNSSLLTSRGIAKAYIESVYNVQSSSDDIKQCSQGLIPWNTTEKVRTCVMHSYHNNNVKAVGGAGDIYFSNT